MKALSRLLTALALVAIVAAAGYFVYDSARTTAIGDILAGPHEYDGKTVLVRGVVTDRMSLAVIGYYTLRDDTGEIKVVSGKALPTIGENLRISGEVREAFSLGDIHVLVILEE